MQKHSDIIILGSGLIGLSTALLFEKSELKSTIVDRTSLNILRSNTDKRTTAISQGSAQIYKEIGIWNKLSKYAQPIYQIKVTEGIDQKGIIFDHKMTNEGVMGYIVENRYIKKFLLDKVVKSRRIKLCLNIEVKGLKEFKNDSIKLQTNQGMLGCELLVGADGRNSKIREVGDFKYYHKDYKQNAYVFNITHSSPHKGIALERFFESGPLAILPMKNNNQNKSSVVFTIEKDINFNNLKEFKEYFNEKYQNFFGEILKFSKISSFPLNIYSCFQYYKKNIVLVGDACQALHPIAGQGFNLGLRDSFFLSQSIKKAKLLGEKVNSTSILREYSRKRFVDKSLLVGSTHNLNKLFSFKGKIISEIRRLGISLFNQSAYLKRKSMLFAMGIRDF